MLLKGFLGWMCKGERAFMIVGCLIDSRKRMKAKEKKWLRRHRFYRGPGPRLLPRHALRMAGLSPGVKLPRLPRTYSYEYKAQQPPLHLHISASMFGLLRAGIRTVWIPLRSTPDVDPLDLDAAFPGSVTKVEDSLCRWDTEADT